MDRQLKERLVGVGVIVALMIVFVPMILDGPETAGMHSKPVDLPRQDRSGWKEKTFSLERDDTGETGAERADAAADEPDAKASTPEETAGTRRAAGGGEGGSSAPREPAPEAAAEDSTDTGAEAGSSGEPPEPKPDGDATPEAAGGWAVQVGSFSSENNAQRLATRLREAGFDVYVTPFRQSGRELYRVRVGPVAGRAAAERLAARVRDETDGPAKPVPAE